MSRPNLSLTHEQLSNHSLAEALLLKFKTNMKFIKVLKEKAQEDPTYRDFIRNALEDNRRLIPIIQQIAGKKIKSLFQQINKKHFMFLIYRELINGGNLELCYQNSHDEDQELSIFLHQSDDSRYQGFVSPRITIEIVITGDEYNINDRVRHHLEYLQTISFNQGDVLSVIYKLLKHNQKPHCIRIHRQAGYREEGEYSYNEFVKFQEETDDKYEYKNTDFRFIIPNRYVSERNSENLFRNLNLILIQFR